MGVQQTLNGVRNFYGQRHRHEGTGGQPRTAGVEKNLVITFAGDSYTAVSVVLPKGAIVHANASVEIEEAFDLGGTTPVLNVGKSGSEGTDRICQISEAQAEAIGTYSIAPAGALAVNTPLTADTTIKVVLGGGGSNTIVTGKGKAKVVVRYTVL